MFDRVLIARSKRHGNRPTTVWDPPVRPYNHCPPTRFPAPALEKMPENPSPKTDPADDAALAAQVLGDLQRQMHRLQREIRLAIQNQLSQMTGRSLGSLEANRELARSIQEMLDAHGLRVRCCQCGHPAILRVSPRSGAAHGVFVFDHTIDGHRTFHGGRNCIPEIRLVAKPVRQTRGGKGGGKNNASDANRAAG